MTASNQKTVTLTASTVATITFATRYNYLVIENLEQTTVSDTMIIYGAEGGVVPTIAGDDCFAVDPGQSIAISNIGPFWWQGGISSAEKGIVANPGTTIKLISAGTPTVSVIGAS